MNIPKKLAYLILAAAILVCGGSAFSWWRSGETRRHFERAEAFVNAADGPKAEAEWKAALASDPKNVAAQELLAEYYFSRQNWPAGAKAFQQWHQLAPDAKHVLCKLAACQLRMDDQKAAFDTAQAEIKRDPDCVAALGLAASLMAQRPGMEARQQLNYLRRLVRLQPDDPDIERMYAETLTDQFMYDELRPVAAKLLLLRPGDAQAYNLLGLADLARADQPQGATDALINFQNSLKSASANAGAHFGLGRAYLALNRPADAVKELENAAQSLPNLSRVHKELATAYRLSGQREKANAAQERFLFLNRLGSEQRVLTVRCAAFPNDPIYPKQLGELSLRLGDPLKALYYLKRANELKPGDSQVTQRIARAAADAADPNLAAGKYIK